MDIPEPLHPATVATAPEELLVMVYDELRRVTLPTQPIR